MRGLPRGPRGHQFPTRCHLSPCQIWVGHAGGGGGTRPPHNVWVGGIPPRFGDSTTFPGIPPRFRGFHHGSEWLLKGRVRSGAHNPRSRSRVMSLSMLPDVGTPPPPTPFPRCTLFPRCTPPAHPPRAGSHWLAHLRVGAPEARRAHVVSDAPRGPPPGGPRGPPPGGPPLARGGRPLCRPPCGFGT